MPRHEDQPRARISILGNNEKDCTSAYYRIDFGTGGYQDDNRTCEGVVKFQVEMEIIFVGRFDLRLHKIWLFNGLSDCNSEMYKVLKQTHRVVDCSGHHIFCFTTFLSRLLYCPQYSF